jgi:hypothetical protein
MTNSDQVTPTNPVDEAPQTGAIADNQPQDAASPPMTHQQAEDILTELKSIKQNIFWLLLIGGFFAARSVFFHY